MHTHMHTHTHTHTHTQLPLLQDAMEELRKFEGELKVKSSLLSNLRIDVSSAESFSRLKGTAHLYVGGEDNCTLVHQF